MRTKFVLFIVSIMVLATFTACNRNKNNTVNTLQLVEQTVTPEANTATAPQTATAETIFEFENGTIISYNGTETSIVIPSQIQGQAVTTIGHMAFTSKQLTNVTIPDSVTLIMELAFAGNQLTSVTIPDSVIMMGDLVFAGNQLTSVTIGANVDLKYFSLFSDGDGFNAAYNNNGKQAGTYTLSNGVWSLSGSHQQTTAESDFEFSNGTITGYIGTETTVVIPSEIQGQTVTAIGSFAFDDRVLESVTIPNSVTRIERRAFNRTYPNSITIGEGVDLGTEGSISWEDEAFIGRGYFDRDYEEGGKQAGTYTFNNEVWTRQ